MAVQPIIVLLGAALQAEQAEQVAARYLVVLAVAVAADRLREST